VQFGDLHYQVFPTPGLSAKDLVIPDDAACGLEPLAYVGELQAGVRFLSLVTGHLEVDSVRLVEASVNISRCGSEGWNFSRVLERMARDVRNGGRGPKVEIRDSRVNFRDGTLKSVYFLNGVDLDLDPPNASSGALKWRYEASPARTDRSEQGFGRFIGSGRWTVNPQGQGRIEVDVDLERSAISELVTLLAGAELGVHGRFLAHATLDGTMNDLRVRGAVELEGVDRQGFFAQWSNQYSLPFSGRIDVLNQSVEVRTDKPGGSRPALPLGLRLTCRGMLTDPRWEAAVEFSEIQAPALVELARRLGAHMPDGLKLEGAVAGTLRIAQAEPPEGDVTVRDARISLRDSAPIEAAETHFELRGSELTLEPTSVAAAGATPVELAGQWDFETERLAFSLRGSHLKLNTLRGALARLEGVGAPVLLDACTDGELEGTLRYERSAAAAEDATWSGDVKLGAARCAVVGLGEPLRVESAHVTLQKDGWTVRQANGEWGHTKWNAEMQVPVAPRPPRLALALDSIEGAEVDALLRPGLTPRRGFIDRTLRRQAQAPAWLRARRMEGTLKVNELRVSDQRFTDITTKVFWRAGQIDLPDLAAHWDDAPFSGRLSVKLQGEAPEYALRGRVEGYPSQAGNFDADVELTLSQLAAPLSAVLRGTAQISARDVDLGDETARVVNATVDYDGARTQRRVRMDSVDAQIGGEWLSGQGAGGADGKLALELTSPRRALRVTGHWPPLSLTAGAR
jgi:hypothetical protein